MFNQISFVSDDSWTETGINYTNKPASDPFFGQFLSYVNEPLDFDVTSLVRAALSGEGSLIEVVGPPGVGKTRLHAELRAIASEMRLISASCDLYSSSTPYGVARSVLLGALELDANADRDTIVSRLMQAIWNSAPGVTTWVPLLGVPLGLDLPTNPEVDQLGQDRGEVAPRECFQKA